MTESPTTVNRRTVLGGAAAVGGAAALATALPGVASAATTSMHVGRGIGDMTGDLLGNGMNGYAAIEQKSTGLQMRQRARAFLFADSPTSARVVLVTCEIGLMFQSIQQEVLRRLASRFGSTYTEANVLLTATHTHSAPGGTSGHPMVDLSMGGFRPRTFENNVAGIVDAVVMAHADLAPSEVGVTTGILTDAGVNRSIDAFHRDPQAEQDALPGAIDPRSQSLQITRGGRLMGVLNWFATHGTSMTKNTTACSTDNKGYAAWYWERKIAGQDYLAPGTPSLITAFAQSNPGDISANLWLRPGQGPTPNEYENCRIIGERQYTAAASQVGRDVREIGTGIDVRHTWVDMASVTVRPEFTDDGRTHTTAPAMLGASFASGSQQDGGGGDGLPFTEGPNPWVSATIGVVIPQPIRDAHAPKDCLIPCGLIPNFIQQVFPFHLVRIGGHHIFGLGFEPTIVAGLRLRRTLAEALGVPEDHVTVQGYTNGYGHYLTTREEYQQQDYEGGATAYGPWSLAAVQQIAHDLAVAMRTGVPVSPGALKRDLTGSIPVSPVANPGPDVTPPFRRFGDVLVAPNASYRRGEKATVSFVGANPNSDVKRGKTLLTVEQNVDGAWQRVHDDADWSTFLWFSQSWGATTAKVDWAIPADTAPGTYRIVYTGSGRRIDGSLFPITGTSPTFAVS